MHAYRPFRKFAAFVIVPGVCVVAAHAQQGDAAAMRTLEKVRANVEASVAALPNIDCEEHVRSVQIIDNKVKHEITLDSTIRATRQPNADEFKEERSIHTLNGKTPKKQPQVTLPLSLAGGFGNSFSPYLSLKYERCHEYELVPSGRDRETLLEVVDKLENYRDPVCSQFSVDTKARFWLDADSLRILRMEAVSPHAGERIGLKTLSTRTEYALVPLGQSSYLLPARVHAELARNDGSVAEQYDAEYSKCRRYGATVKILPGVSEAPGKPE
jgi:hypothetical protein